MPPTFRIMAALSMLALAGAASAGKVYEFDVEVDFTNPDADCHLVHIELEQDAHLLREMDWDPVEAHSDWRGEPEPVIRDGRRHWLPPAAGGWLEYCVDLDHRRGEGGYDSRVTADFALFRGDDLVPAARTRTAAGARSRTTIAFDLPADWSVVTRYRQLDDGHFLAADPERRFDRPTGWMVAGNLGVRRDTISGVKVIIAGPVDHGIRRMDLMAFLNFLIPEFDALMPRLPERLLIVSAGGPFWLGGLSGPESVYLHADRPIVSGNATSSLVHELTHVFMGAYGGPDDDWLAEGLAEFYAVELLYRAGGMTRGRRERAWTHLAEWGEDVETLRGRSSTGSVTARAAVFLRAFDTALREEADASLDEITAGLIRRGGPLTLEGLRAVCAEVAEPPVCDFLESGLLETND